MKPIKTITSTEMRGINRSAILELIRRSGPTSRSAIAETLEISLPTVMRIVDSLIEEVLVIPTGPKEWSGGRKRSMVKFNASGHLIIGIDLGGTKMYGALADLGGNILQEATIPHHNTTGQASYQRLIELIEELLPTARTTGKILRGIGVGVPGITDHETGRVQWAAGIDWRDFPLKDRLVADFHLPVIVDNDVNLAALGELGFGLGQNAENLVVIAVGTGIGAGVVIDGALYRGSHQVAGEIGYLIPDRSLLGQPYPEFGALEQLASGPGITRRARQALDSMEQTPVLISPDQLDRLVAEDVFEAARRKEPWACQVVNDTVDYLAQAVAALAVCFDPDLIILGGGVARSADLLIEPILSRLAGALPIQPRLVASQLGYQATVLGTIANLLYQTSDFYILRKIS